MNSTEYMAYWNALSHPPASALREIRGGRLNGKTDINPQWRYQAMTETFGPCGVGWKYEIEQLWTEPGTEGQVCAFARINLYVTDSNDTWSKPIPGIGGSMLIESEKAGLHTSDEAYKMAVTDALSVAMKMLGVGAAIYAGAWDGTKYRDTPAVAPQTPQHASKPPEASTHHDGQKHVNAEGSCVNAGARVDKGAAILEGRMANDPAITTVNVKGVPTEVARFDIEVGDEKLSVTAWHDARDEAMQFHSGDEVEVTGTWNHYRDKWNVNAAAVRDVIPF